MIFLPVIVPFKNNISGFDVKIMICFFYSATFAQDDFFLDYLMELT